MEMVSASKLNRVKSVFFSSKPYFSNLERVLFSFLSDSDSIIHPLLEERIEKRSIALVVITSDTGLCSTYNNNVLKSAAEFADKIGREKIRIIAAGKEAFSYFKKGSDPMENSYLGMRGKFSAEIASEITTTLIKMFTEHQADEIYIAHTHFSPNLRHAPAVEKFLPISYERKARQYYLLEPEKDTILNNIIEKYLLAKMRVVLLDSFTAEHSARMLAMKLATDNADDLISILTLLKNKARQTAITKEVLEIAASAEAVKG